MHHCRGRVIKDLAAPPFSLSFLLSHSHLGQPGGTTHTLWRGSCQQSWEWTGKWVLQPRRNFGEDHSPTTASSCNHPAEVLLGSWPPHTVGDNKCLLLHETKC